MMKPTDKVTLSHALKQHFARTTLSNEQLKNLTTLQKQLQSEYQENKTRTRKQNQVNGNHQIRRLYSWLPHLRYQLATALIVILIMVFGLPFMESGDLARKIVNEVAYNHNKQLVMEINTADLTKIAGYLSQLGFSLIRSKQLPEGQWKLLGGRFCSINGKLAAQLRMHNRENDQIYTLYQALLPRQMADMNQIEEYADGVRVNLWQEQGLLLGLAGIQ